MNRPTHDEYEEVESPFATNRSEPSRSGSRDRLRTKKNVYNRPFAAGPSVAPAVFETTSTRRSLGHPDSTELARHRQSELDQAQIEYLDEEMDEEEEIVERRPARVTSSKKNAKSKKNLLAKIGWAAIGLLVLRLICMDRGVWDYFATESGIRERQNELKSIHSENKEIKTEISRIQVDKNYQRQLAKEHLGVIAVDEFLILFAGETPEADSTSSRL